MKKMMFLGMLSLMTFLFGCKEEEETCNTTGVTYTNTIKAIFDASCAKSGCHAAGSSDGALNDFASSKAFAAGGRIVGSIKHSTGFSSMPKGGSKLSDCEISQVEAWIAAGTPQ